MTKTIVIRNPTGIVSVVKIFSFLSCECELDFTVFVLQIFPLVFPSFFSQCVVDVTDCLSIDVTIHGWHLPFVSVVWVFISQGMRVVCTGPTSFSGKPHDKPICGHLFHVGNFVHENDEGVRGLEALLLWDTLGAEHISIFCVFKKVMGKLEVQARAGAIDQEDFCTFRQQTLHGVKLSWFCFLNIISGRKEALAQHTFACSCFIHNEMNFSVIWVRNRIVDKLMPITWFEGWIGRWFGAMSAKSIMTLLHASVSDTFMFVL